MLQQPQWFAAVPYWALVLRPWYRIKEGSREDNNPDIEDYIGRGDAMLVYRHGNHELAAIARHSLRGGDRSHGALQLDWGFPLDGPLRGHIQVFSGYGESLIDYNHRQNVIGLGFSVADWFADALGLGLYWLVWWWLLKNRLPHR